VLIGINGPTNFALNSKHPERWPQQQNPQGNPNQN
jgi:hypothetical protein